MPNKCAICYKCYSLERNLFRHLREAHSVFPAPQPNKGFKCQEKDCEFSASRLGALRNHLHKTHLVKFEKVELTFECHLEFEKWKDQEEGETKYNFVRERGRQTLKSGDIKECLPCHRSGNFLPKGNGKRVLKRQGTRKLGTRCTAEMEVVTCKNGSIFVTYHKTHYGHTPDVEHIILSRNMRNKITEKLSGADSIDTILAEVHSHGTQINHSKLKILQRKDMLNLLRWIPVKKSRAQPKFHQQINEQAWLDLPSWKTHPHFTTREKNKQNHTSDKTKLDRESYHHTRNNTTADHCSILKVPEGPSHRLYVLAQGGRQRPKNAVIVTDVEMQCALQDSKQGHAVQKPCSSFGEALHPSEGKSKHLCSMWREIVVPVIDPVALENTVCVDFAQYSRNQNEDYSEVVVVHSSK